MKTTILTFVCAMMLAISQGGCIFLAAGAAGVGTAKWMSDKVGQEVDKPMVKVADAVKDVFKDLHMKMTSESATTQMTQLLAKYSDGRQVWVDVRVVDAHNSRVDVRVGWINGEADAHKILEHIVKKVQAWL